MAKELNSGPANIRIGGLFKTARLHFDCCNRDLANTYICAATDGLNGIEMLSIECRKPKTKVITLANHKEHKQSSEPIKTQSEYLQPTEKCGKICASDSGFRTCLQRERVKPASGLSRPEL